MADDAKKNDVAKLRELIKDIQVAMLVTVHSDSSMRARPMMTREMDDEGTLWFFTGVSTEKAGEIAQDQHVCVAYSSPKDQRYVSVSGKAQIVRDAAKAKDLWNPAYKAWFPKGLEDPELALVRVSVEGAEYWDPPNSAVVYLFGLAKAMLTGQQYKSGPGEHGTVEVKSGS